MAVAAAAPAPVVTGTTEGDPAAARLLCSPLLEGVALAPLPLEVTAATESCGGLGQHAAVDGLAAAAVAEVVAEVVVGLLLLVPTPPLGTLLLARVLDPTMEEEEQKEEEEAAEVAAVSPAVLLVVAVAPLLDPTVDFIPDAVPAAAAAGVEQVEVRPDEPSATAAN